MIEIQEKLNKGFTKCMCQGIALLFKHCKAVAATHWARHHKHFSLSLSAKIKSINKINVTRILGANEDKIRHVCGQSNFFLLKTSIEMRSPTCLCFMPRERSQNSYGLWEHVILKQALVAIGKVGEWVREGWRLGEWESEKVAEWGSGRMEEWESRRAVDLITRTWYEYNCGNIIIIQFWRHISEWNIPCTSENFVCLEASISHGVEGMHLKICVVMNTCRSESKLFWFSSNNACWVFWQLVCAWCNCAINLTHRARNERLLYASRFADISLGINHAAEPSSLHVQLTIGPCPKVGRLYRAFHYAVIIQHTKLAHWFTIGMYIDQSKRGIVIRILFGEASAAMKWCEVRASNCDLMRTSGWLNLEMQFLFRKGAFQFWARWLQIARLFSFVPPRTIHFFHYLKFLRHLYSICQEAEQGVNFDALSLRLWKNWSWTNQFWEQILDQALVVLDCVYFNSSSNV